PRLAFWNPTVFRPKAGAKTDRPVTRFQGLQGFREIPAGRDSSPFFGTLIREVPQSSRRTNAASVKTFVSFACFSSCILETGGLSLPLKQRAFRYPSLSMQARTTDATLLATVTLSSSDPH